jgi:hypothetical protein
MSKVRVGDWGNEFARFWVRLELPIVIATVAAITSTGGGTPHPLVLCQPLKVPACARPSCSIRENQTSTRFIQEAWVGLPWMAIRGCWASHFVTLGCLCAA